ncbi:MAG: hypothetical protein MI723_02850 [Caulobacterales bacterium]|nr:hypothetical protein [Caulobacterales bacterium]
MTKRIAMWSGPRNISTTMMRSFENRPDCVVVDEPFYACFLSVTGARHPMREAVIASQPTDWRAVVADLTEAEAGAPIVFQKHMTHHLTPEMDREWLADLDHVFLIREPARMVASYAARMEEVTPDALGLAAEARLFDEVAERTGRAPPVVDAGDVCADPRGVLTKLCAALAIPFREEMLAWPAGRRDSDGVWAPHWYGAVETSTGFRAPDRRALELAGDLRAVAAACAPHYERLYVHRLTPTASPGA